MGTRYNHGASLVLCIFGPPLQQNPKKTQTKKDSTDLEILENVLFIDVHDINFKKKIFKRNRRTRMDTVGCMYLE